MKQRTIVTLEGIYVLDKATGFYVPEQEPGEERWPLWLGLGLAFIAGAGALYCIYRAVMAWAGA